MARYKQSEDGYRKYVRVFTFIRKEGGRTILKDRREEEYIKIRLSEKNTGNQIILNLHKITDSTHTHTHTYKVTLLGVKMVFPRAVEIEYQVKLKC